MEVIFPYWEKLTNRIFPENHMKQTPSFFLLQSLSYSHSIILYYFFFTNFSLELFTEFCLISSNQINLNKLSTKFKKYNQKSIIGLKVLEHRRELCNLSWIHLDSGSIDVPLDRILFLLDRPHSTFRSTMEGFMDNCMNFQPHSTLSWPPFGLVGIRKHC